MALKYEQYLIQQAREVSGRWKVFALITKGGKPIVATSNNLARRGNCAERRCLRRVKGDLTGARIYVVRIKQGNGTLGLAKPCDDCIIELRTRGIRRVYYSVDANKWSEMRL